MLSLKKERSSSGFQRFSRISTIVVALEGPKFEHPSLLSSACLSVFVGLGLGPAFWAVTVHSRVTFVRNTQAKVDVPWDDIVYHCSGKVIFCQSENKRHSPHRTVLFSR